MVIEPFILIPTHPTPAIAAVGGSSLFAGPIIAREVLTAPRPGRYYLARASFSGFLFILMWTAWQSLIGWQTSASSACWRVSAASCTGSSPCSS